MKKMLPAFAFALFLCQPLLADQYQVVRTESYDAQNTLTAIDWKDWDYFNNKDLLFPVREGMSNGREFTYKYEADAKFANPSKRTAFLVKSTDGAPVSTSAWYSQTLYNYNAQDFLTFEFTTYANGDKESITYKLDAKNRVIEKTVEWTTAADKKKTTSVFTYSYVGELRQPSKVSLKDGTYSEELHYSSANLLQKKEVYRDGALSATVTYNYNELKLVSEQITAGSVGEVLSREKYFYGMYKPTGEVRKNLDDWLKRYTTDGASLETVLRKYYFTVARNPQYNDQLRNAYYIVANMYFKKEQYESAIMFYKKAIGYGKSNVAGSEDISVLRRYFYARWDISTAGSTGTEYFCAYNIACCLTRLNQWDDALLWLDLGWQIGFNDAALMMSDKDLQFLKLMKEEEFTQIKDRTWKPPQ
jgi:tetratricopeptide (TPR) repeat protein